jgi:hypothetical protein
LKIYVINADFQTAKIRKKKGMKNYIQDFNPLNKHILGVVKAVFVNFYTIYFTFCKNILILCKVYFTFVSSTKLYNLMTTLFLFPNSWKKAGWVLFIIPILVCMYFWITESSMDAILKTKVFAIYNDEFLGKKGFFQIIENHILDELLLITCLIGGLMVGFGRTKIEDEMVIAIRYESLVWATYFNITFMILGTAFIYGVGYFNFMIFSMISSLVFFIVRFQIKLYLIQKGGNHDE